MTTVFHGKDPAWVMIKIGRYFRINFQLFLITLFEYHSRQVSDFYFAFDID